MSERPKVLVVDDIPSNLLVLEGILAPLECELVCARSGNEALRCATAQDFAAALLDVQMPQMDGFELAFRLREDVGLHDVPVVFVTAFLDSRDHLQRSYANLRGFDFLFKPVEPNVVRNKVQFFLDLYSSRRRLQAEVEAHRQTLAEVEAFNYSVSHDLRGPLRPLDGFCEVLLEDYAPQLDERGRDYLHRIRAAAQRMGHLIDDLLELSRVSRADLLPRPVDLSAVVAEIDRELRAEEARTVELLCPPAITAAGDARLLRIALENLLRNAWKFTARQPRPQIEFGRRDEREPVYFVRDNGVGFDQTYAGKMFQPFQRLHGAEFAGTGIGLAIVQRIVRRHGGRIWAESTVGQGATFFFTLPV